MQSSCNPIFPGRQVRLTSTAKPITPFGGLVSLMAFFAKIGLAGQISGLMPFTYTSRERIRENKSAVGRRLIDVDGYTFRVFVTNRQGDGAELWRDYNQRACCEQHLEALKNDLQADGFCMKDFYATESAFLSVCFTYNLLSLYQHASSPEQRNKTGFKRPATLRAAVFIGGAVLATAAARPCSTSPKVGVV
jgi:hypothetical protein